MPRSSASNHHGTEEETPTRTYGAKSGGCLSDRRRRRDPRGHGSRSRPVLVGLAGNPPRLEPPTGHRRPRRQTRPRDVGRNHRRRPRPRDPQKRGPTTPSKSAAAPNPRANQRKRRRTPMQEQRSPLAN